MARNLTWKGMASFKDTVLILEMTGSDQMSCCSELVRKENIKKEDGSFLLPVLRLTLLWKVS